MENDYGGRVVMSMAVSLVCLLGSTVLNILGEHLLGVLHLIAGSIFYLAYIIDNK